MSLESLSLSKTRSTFKVIPLFLFVKASFEILCTVLSDTDSNTERNYMYVTCMYCSTHVVADCLESILRSLNLGG